VLVADGHLTTPSSDPELVYQDIVIALSKEKGINNGEPSLHARMLAAAAPRPGERVLQVGTGSGYYTALLAELVGPAGRVTALDIDPEMAAWASRTLRSRANVEVQCRSGAEPPLPESDVIYVNAGATAPIAAWREALSPAGRLLFPLTPGWGFGAILLATRTGMPTVFGARFVTRAAFIPCVGGQSEAAVARLRAAFKGGGWTEVRSLRCATPPDESCWYDGDGWWLSRHEP
jgi:protein-L-isoaspartate(D-aspartate) O-methyltransferase